MSQEDITGTTALPFSYQRALGRWLLWDIRTPNTIAVQYLFNVCGPLWIQVLDIAVDATVLASVILKFSGQETFLACWLSGVSRRMFPLSRTRDIWNRFTLHFFFLLELCFFHFERWFHYEVDWNQFTVRVVSFRCDSSRHSMSSQRMRSSCLKRAAGTLFHLSSLQTTNKVFSSVILA